MKTELIQRAVVFAQKAVDIEPNHGSYWNTLGVAHYRIGDWQTAIGTLEKSDELSKGDFLGFNGFFLATAHWQLGHQDEAHQHYQESVDWMKKHMPDDEELRRFRAEAAELLGMPVETNKPAEKPEKTETKERQAEKKQ